MSVDDVLGRLLNPGVILTLIAAGAAYGYAFLWALNVRPLVRLYAVAIVPGLVFGITILAIRALQSVPSVVYLVLVVDWLIFAHAALLTVLARRRRARR